MTLQENPIFLTQQRLVHRAGVLAPILIAAVVGLSLLGGLIAYMLDPLTLDFHSAKEAGRVFYALALGIQAVVLVYGGLTKIAQTLAEERKAGLLDSNRLTPMRPCAILMGYWLGSPLRELYIGAVLSAIGLVIVLLAGLPLKLWLGTQILLISTTLLFGLLAILTGMATQWPQTMLVLLLPLLVLIPFCLEFPMVSIISFLIPVYAAAHAFADGTGARAMLDNWHGWPWFFGQPIPAFVLSAALQGCVGAFLWRSAVRKIAEPSRPFLLRWEALTVFTILVFVQHGLVWETWRGRFPTLSETASGFWPERAFSPIVHGLTLFLGACMLSLAAFLPERVRTEVLRTGSAGRALVLRHSVVPLAAAFAAIAVVAMTTQAIFTLSDVGVVFAIVIGNLVLCFLMFSLLIEYCRLRFTQRWLSFVVFGLFVLCVLPFMLDSVFSYERLSDLSFIAPGVIALGLGPDKPGFRSLGVATLVHFVVVAALFILWLRQWKVAFAQNKTHRNPKQQRD